MAVDRHVIISWHLAERIFDRTRLHYWARWYQCLSSSHGSHVQWNLFICLMSPSLTLSAHARSLTNGRVNVYLRMTSRASYASQTVHSLMLATTPIGPSFGWLCDASHGRLPVLTPQLTSASHGSLWISCTSMQLFIDTALEREMWPLCRWKHFLLILNGLQLGSVPSAVDEFAMLFWHRNKQTPRYPICRCPPSPLVGL